MKPVPVLATKLYIPPLRENAVARPHLVQRLHAGAGLPGGVTLVSGPAGFGKTSLLSAFIAQLDGPAAWVSLDEEDNDAARFWTYLINACQTAWEGIGGDALELLATTQALPEDVIPTILINEITRQNGSLVLVLDDYHEIQNASIQASVLFLLDHLPPNLHPVISTRIDPPWPLGRFRARNRLIEIRIRDLRFSASEAAEFLKRTMGLNLTHEDVSVLEERTEGWAAGLQLAALSLQGRSDVRAFLEGFTGSHQYVAEYLVEEILKRQSPDSQSFLLRTSILERLNAGLCEAVSGCEDGQSMLNRLHRANVFLVSLDGEGRWFRYHHLFADLLRASLLQASPAEAIQALHRSASQWYEGNGDTSEAIHHALAGEDFERAAELVMHAARGLIFTGQVNVLRGWLNALPQASFQERPQLSFYLFWIDVLQSRADLSEGSVQDMEALLERLPASAENDRLRGELMAVVCRAIALSGSTARGIRLAEQALAYLPAEDLASRARANSALAIAHDLEGRAGHAAPLYREAISQATSAGDYRLAAHTMMLQGLVQFQYGRLHEAARTFQAIIDMPRQLNIAPGDQPEASSGSGARTSGAFFPAGEGHIGLGSLYLEWNDLEMAEKHLERGMELCRRGGVDGVFIGRMHTSRLAQARGNLDAALAEIDASGQSSARADDFNVATRRIQIGLARGDLDGAWRWAAPLAEVLGRGPEAARIPVVFREMIQAIIARVYLARGEVDKALHLLESLEATAEPGQRLGRMIEVHLIRALAHRARGSGGPMPDADESLRQALELGEPQGYFTTFLEEGAALAPLLQAVAESRSTPQRIKDYARALLEALEVSGEAPARPASQAGGLVEALTPREMEVLELLACGASNQDIADELVITVRTVKKHTGNIYGKLNVDNRLQAVARAHLLSLLSTD